MLISVCIAERYENYSPNSESLCLSIFDYNTEQRIFHKVYVACVFFSALDVKWFQIKHYHPREKPVLVYARFQRYLSSSFLSAHHEQYL